uniref:Putative capsid protein n=1 Tax=viral metagenome TaxID=1070528 RepID=A0A6M3KHF7_9ZZZZ
MASNAIPAVNIAPYIPEMWGLIVVAAAENNLEFVQHTDRRFEKELKYGDTLNVPNLTNFSGAQNVDTTGDLTLYDVIQTCTAIVVNYHYYQAVGLGDQEQIQDRPDFLKAALKKCGYDIALIQDLKVSALVNGLNKSEGTEGSALTADVLINCYEDMNANSVPDSDRVWIFDPKSITDLLKIDYFVRYDYVPEGVVSKGFQGRQIFGAPVYMTQHLNVINTSYHAATYMHKEALAIISQESPTIFNFRWPEKFTDVVGVKTLFGVKEMRDTWGIWIKTRN